MRGSGHLAVEDVLRCGLLVLHVPHEGHAVGLVRSVLVVVVRRNQEFRVLETEESAQMNVGGGADVPPRPGSMWTSLVCVLSFC